MQPIYLDIKTFKICYIYNYNIYNCWLLYDLTMLKIAENTTKILYIIVMFIVNNNIKHRFSKSILTTLQIIITIEQIKIPNKRNRDFVGV